jgi:hypothetical protein
MIKILNVKNTIVIMILILTISSIATFIILNQKNSELENLTTEIESKKSQITDEQDRLTELIFENLDGQIEDKIDSVLNLGKFIIYTNVENNINIKKATIDAGKKIFNRGLYVNELNRTYYGNENGIWIIAENNPKKEIWIIDVDNDKGDIYQYDESSADFSYSRDIGPIDYREHEWYKDITKDNQELWIDPFVNYQKEAFNTMTTAFAKGVFDENGQKIGVWANEIALSSIDEYLEKIKPTKNTKINLLFVPQSEITVNENESKNNIIRYTDYNYEDFHWTIQWMIPKDEFEKLVEF